MVCTLHNVPRDDSALAVEHSDREHTVALQSNSSAGHHHRKGLVPRCRPLVQPRASGPISFLPGVFQSAGAVPESWGRRQSF